MIHYRYTAEDPQGKPVDGHLAAATVEEARRRLEREGYRVLEVVQADWPERGLPPQERLTAGEAQELAENLAQLSAAALPLASGLRAAGDESDSPELARAFRYLADELDRGRPLEEVLESSRDFLPAHVSGLIHAALRTGQLGPALTELVEHYRDAGMLRQTIRDGLAYPLFVAGLAATVLLFIILVVTGAFEQVFDDFGMELPPATIALLWFRHAVIWLLPAFLAALLLFIAVVRWLMGRAGWHRLLASAPVVGPLWHWLCLLEWMGLLRVLVLHGMPLLDALRLSAEGTSNANVRHLSLALAEGVARGRTLSQLIAAQRQLPASLGPLVRWGEEAGGLVDSLEVGCELLEDRVRIRSFWLHAAVPPLLFLAIGSAVPFVFAASFMPLISLISSLS